MSARRRWRRDPVAVSDRVGRFRGGPAPGSDVARLAAAWADVAGPSVGRQSIVVRRSRAGVVAVACASAAWAQELDLRRDHWSRLLAAAVPDVPVTGLRFVVGDHVMPAAEPDARPRVRPTGAELERADAATPLIDDPVLRDLLVRAQAGQMAVQRQRKRLQKAKKPGQGGRAG